MGFGFRFAVFVCARDPTGVGVGTADFDFKAAAERAAQDCFRYFHKSFPFQAGVDRCDAGEGEEGELHWRES